MELEFASSDFSNDSETDSIQSVQSPNVTFPGVGTPQLSREDSSRFNNDNHNVSDHHTHMGSWIYEAKYGPTANEEKLLVSEPSDEYEQPYRPRAISNINNMYGIRDSLELLKDQLPPMLHELGDRDETDDDDSEQSFTASTMTHSTYTPYSSNDHSFDDFGMRLKSNHGRNINNIYNKTRTKQHTHIWLPISCLLKQFSEECIDNTFILQMINRLYPSKVAFIRQIMCFLNEKHLHDLHDMLQQQKLQINVNDDDTKNDKAVTDENKNENDDNNDRNAIEHTRYFDKLSDIPVTNICSFLDKKSILKFKNTSTQIAVCCLNEMRKHKVGCFNMMELLNCREYNSYQQFSRITFGDIVKFSRYKPTIKSEYILYHWQRNYNIPTQYMFVLKLYNARMHGKRDKVLKTLTDSKCSLFVPNTSIKKQLETKHVSTIKGGVFLLFDNRSIKFINDKMFGRLMPRYWCCNANEGAGLVMLYYFNIKKQTMKLIKYLIASRSDNVRTLSDYIENDEKELMFDDDETYDLLHKMKKFSKEHALFRIYNASYLLSDYDDNPMILEHTVSHTTNPALLLPNMQEFDAFIFSINNEHPYFRQNHMSNAYFNRIKQTYNVINRKKFYLTPDEMINNSFGESPFYGDSNPQGHVYRRMLSDFTKASLQIPNDEEQLIYEDHQNVSRTRLQRIQMSVTSPSRFSDHEQSIDSNY